MDMDNIYHQGRMFGVRMESLKAMHRRTLEMSVHGSWGWEEKTVVERPEIIIRQIGVKRNKKDNKIYVEQKEVFTSEE